jgi:hypothetical protein
MKAAVTGGRNAPRTRIQGKIQDVAGQSALRKLEGDAQRTRAEALKGSFAPL